jgi:anti-sigma regulatory factor (Ser/Thr protein kinase)
MTVAASDQVELRIPRRAEFVRVARMAACALAAQLEFTYDVMKDVELAVGEACANAVEHVVGESCQDIVVRFMIDSRQLTVEVIDGGKGFDPSRAVGEDRHWEQPGGLGLVVIREVMDEMDVRCDPETGTCVRMIKYRAEQ